MRHLSVFLLMVGFPACVAWTADTADLVIYGSSPAALAAAVQAKRMGVSAVVVSPETRIGGLTTGGLGSTDIGNKAAIGGIAREFYRAIKAHYGRSSAWTWQKREEATDDEGRPLNFSADAMWTFEPSAALSVLEGWVKRDGLEIHRGKRLDRTIGKVKVEGEGQRRKIVSFRTEDGTEYVGKMFLDCTYEGDLLAAAGVTYRVGREANAEYEETVSGIEGREADYHQFAPGVDPYVVKGDPKSGLLPGVEPYDPKEKDGDGDSRVQAYCFRMCLTDVPENRIPFRKPAGYDERDYELLFRNFEAGSADRDNGLPWINSAMPNRKTDTNNRTGFSTDFIGGNWDWPEASYAERERIFAAHLKYQQGLMWTLANHPRVPANVRDKIARWGTCKDEFADGAGDGWQSQLYVREARRLVGDYVMTEHHCRGDVAAPRPVALAAYGMDSHHVRRHVGADGFVHNEGDVEDYARYGRWGRFGGLKDPADPHGFRHPFPPYPIDYGALVPKRGECANLLVPVCLSATHMAFGSIRMEPVFFALGQAAATAAAQAIAAGVAVQDLDYAALRKRLLADGQALVWENRTGWFDRSYPDGRKGPVIGYQLDVSRCKVPTMATLRRMVDLLARLGYNQFQLYTEHTFAYSRHETVWREASPMAPDEIRELDAYCAARGVELVPNQNSFGHLEQWLRHPEYNGLAERPTGGTVRLSWGNQALSCPTSLCPTDPRSERFVAGLYDELFPCFRSRYVNVGCDEVLELEDLDFRGRSGPALKEKGSARVYLDFLKRIHALCAERHHVMMFWGDIILHCPDLIPELPADAVCLNWGYEANHPFVRQTAAFRNAGRRFVVCPGTSAWGSLSGRVGNMLANVDNALANGLANGAEGMLLADWGDGGHPNPWVVSVPALVYAARLIRGERLTRPQLSREIDRLLDCRCGEALLAYGDIYLKAGGRKGNSTELYMLLEDGSDYRRAGGVTDETLQAALAAWREAKGLLDLRGAPEWVKDDFAVLDLLYRAVEVRVNGAAGKNFRALFEPEYRRLWLRQNRLGGLAESLTRVFGRNSD